MPPPYAFNDPPGQPGKTQPSGVDFQAENWPTPADLPEAKKMLGSLRGYKTRKQFDEFTEPTEKYAKVTNLASAHFGKLHKAVMEDLMTNGKENATHFILAHNKDRADYMEVVYEKLVIFTISRVLFKSKYAFWIKEKALHKWIDDFLPLYDRVVFTPQLRESLKGRVRYYN
jgi:hypothetical protein